MKVSIKNNAQGGFTLIELIVVIVILGILAATALPKFASLGGDARAASLNAARGALNATAAMAHGKFLVTTGTPPTKLALEDVTINLTANGYPSADATTPLAAGLAAADYTVYTAHSVATDPPVASGAISIVPKSIAGTSTAATCYVSYAASDTAPPTVSVVSTNCN
jgi:MSHA pilin protein MshA